jgi:hypothetical protein
MKELFRVEDWLRALGNFDFDSMEREQRAWMQLVENLATEKPKFEDLPPKVLLKILGHLEKRDLRSCRNACRIVDKVAGIRRRISNLCDCGADCESCVNFLQHVFDKEKERIKRDSETYKYELGQRAFTLFRKQYESLKEEYRWPC